MSLITFPILRNTQVTVGFATTLAKDCEFTSYHFRIRRICFGVPYSVPSMTVRRSSRSSSLVGSRSSCARLGGGGKLLLLGVKGEWILFPKSTLPVALFVAHTNEPVFIRDVPGK